MKEISKNYLESYDEKSLKMRVLQLGQYPRVAPYNITKEKGKSPNNVVTFDYLKVGWCQCVLCRMPIFTELQILINLFASKLASGDIWHLPCKL